MAQQPRAASPDPDLQRDENAALLAANLSWAHHRIAAVVAHHAGDTEARDTHQAESEVAQAAIAAVLDEEPARLPLARLRRAQGWSAFETAVVQLALAQAMDAALGALLERWHEVPGERALYCTDLPALLLGRFELVHRVQALALLGEDSKLVRGRLLRIERDEDALLGSTLRLRRAALDHLLGLPFAARCAELHTLDAAAPLPRAVVPARQRERLEENLRALLDAHVRGEPAVTRHRQRLLVLFWGEEGVGKTTLARELCLALFGACIELDAHALSTAHAPFAQLEHAVDHAVLGGAGLVVTHADAWLRDGTRARALLDAVRHSGRAVFVTAAEANPGPTLRDEWDLIEHFETPHETSPELWRGHAPWQRALAPDVDLAALSERFRLPGVAVARAMRLATAHAATREAQPIDMALLEASASEQLDHHMGQLVRTVHPRHTLDALVLRPDLKAQVREIIHAYECWHYLMSAWGLGEKISTGKCIACLFTGEPGTGKTFAAEIIARSVGQPLHIVSLPNLLSKWLGETEKNIKELFARAQMSGAVLLFDEADAVFARRVEARGANDHAHAQNATTNALLQELDRHAGLVILTTNLSANIDKAFERRITYTLDFPRPDADERLALWRGLLPAALPLEEDVDLDALAQQFELTGGEIKNVMFRTAIRAWSDQRIIDHDLLWDGCEQEYRRTGKLLQTPLSGDDPFQ